MLRFDIITLFPEIFDAYFHTSILKRAQEKKLVAVHTHNLRDAAEGAHKTVDDKSYGGGAGMLLMSGPILKTVDRILRIGKGGKTKPKPSPRLVGPGLAGRPRAEKIIVFSAKGKQFNQKIAADWAKKYQRIILISGRYEGIDERVKNALHAQEISIGPYVLNDGDVAAMVVVSAVVRLVPGVIKKESLREESHAGDMLEYPQYTRPEEFTYKGKKYRVPKMLLSGNHKKIAEWRNTKRKKSSDKL